MADIEYLLGHDAQELRRLELQAGIMAPGTERILRGAGVGPGQSVLDIGTGAGDVSMLVAGMVGPAGSVLGIDREASVIPHARSRAARAGLANVQFEQATIDALPGQARYDAVIGRYVLLYQPDRAGFLREAARLVRPGGLLLFIEPGLPATDAPDRPLIRPWSAPPVALYDEALRQILVAFRLSGAHIATGSNFVRLFRDAGLPEPSIIHDLPSGGPLSPMVDWVCLTLRSVQPLLERHGIVPIGSGDDLGAFRERMARAVDEVASQMVAADLIGAWIRTGG